MMGWGYGMGGGQAVMWIVGLALWVIPMWRIVGRTGMAPALALIGIIPIIGTLIVLFVIAYGRWPRFDSGAGA